MIDLIRAMVGTRPVRVLIMVLLAAVTIGTAVAVPAFLAAADDSTIQTEVGHAPVTDLDVFATQSYHLDARQPADATFGAKMPAMLASPDFDGTFSAVTDVAVGSGDAAAYPQMEFRQDACDHVVLVSGRCPLSTGEIMIDPLLAKDLGLAPGDPASVVFAIRDPLQGWERSGRSVPMTAVVVGVYRPIDGTEPYWGTVTLFAAFTDRGADAPVLTTPGTIAALDHATEAQTVDEILRPVGMTAARLDADRARAQRAVAAAKQTGAVAASGLPKLVSAIEADRTSVRQIVPILAVPLFGLGWFVIFLAGGYSIAGRRSEIGVVALRGVRRGPLWLLGTGESLLAIAVSIPIGYGLGYAAVAAVDRFAMPHHPPMPGFGAGSLPYVSLVTAGCVLAVIASAWRSLRSPAADLLRDVPPRRTWWRSASVEVALVVLAVFSVITMRGEHGRLVGVEFLAPGLAIAAMAVAVARLVVPFFGWLGGWASRHGRHPGIAIGAWDIARRPGLARLLVLIMSGIGVIAFAAAADDVARQSRDERASMEVGAPTVVYLRPTSRQSLINAVDAIDPRGTFAMAVAHIPQPAPHGPPIIAVQSSRLAAVAAWPRAASMSAERAAAVLAPPVPAPLTFSAETAALTATISPLPGLGIDAKLTLLVEPSHGGAVQELPLGDARSGTHTYGVDTTACVQGCRVAGITFTVSYFRSIPITITLRSLDVVTPSPASITTFSSPTRWRDARAILTGGPMTPTAAPSGGMSLAPATDSGVNVLLEPTDSAFPVPSIATRRFTVTLQGQLGDDVVPMSSTAVSPVLPRVGGDGILVDFTDIDRAVPAVGDLATEPEVWLSSSAPAGVVSRLSGMGLSVVGVASIGEARGFLGRRGAAVGGLFVWVVVAGAVVLMVGGVVLASGTGGVRWLWWLRVQGLSAAGVGGALRMGLQGMVVVAWLAGVAGGLVVWWLTGGGVPVFDDGFVLAGGRAWPSVWGVAWVVGVVGVVLLTVSWVAALRLRALACETKL